MKKYFLILTLSIGMISSYAQQKCATVYDASKLTPQTRQEVENFYERVEDMIQNRESQMLLTYNFDPYSGVVLIPVVVHVVYNTTAQNISDAQICSQIDVLNEDFARRNPDSGDTPSQFLGVAANTEIQFYLATRDPNGNITDGITRTSTTTTSFTDNDRVKSSSTGGHNPWDTNKYLNIWVCNLQSFLGYSSWPWDYDDHPELDGVVIDFEGFGDIGTAASPYDLGRTATHEVGHWLGLLHIWGDDGSACTGSDGISDTPNQGGSYLGNCPSGNQVSCSSNDMYMNYMDYTDDACMNISTTGQKTAMRTTLNSYGYREDFEYYLPSVSFSSTPVVCNSNKNFTLQNLPIGATVSWSVTPSGVFVNSSGTGTTATLRTTSSSVSSSATLTFFVEGSCGTAYVSEDIQAGKFSTSQVWVTGQVAVCPGKDYDYTANVELGHYSSYSYSWTIPSGWTVLEQSANQIRLRVPSSNPSGGAVRVSVNNGCGGATGYTGITVYPIYCGGYFKLIPNPVSDEMEVQLNSEGQYQINIFDWNGNEVTRVNIISDRYILNVQKYPAGVYYLQVVGKGVFETQRFLVE